MDDYIMQRQVKLKSDLLVIKQEIIKTVEEYEKMLIALKKYVIIDDDIIYNEEFIENKNMLSNIINRVDNVIFSINEKI